MKRHSAFSGVQHAVVAIGIIVSALGASEISSASADTADSIMASAKLARARAVCLNGYVWREAGYNDLVCVLPGARTRVAVENSWASMRRQGYGAYGPNTCRAGYVWRDAFAGDQTCVEPASRALAAAENAQAVAHRVYK